MVNVRSLQSLYIILTFKIKGNACMTSDIDVLDLAQVDSSTPALALCNDDNWNKNSCQNYNDETENEISLGLIL